MLWEKDLFGIEIEKDLFKKLKWGWKVFYIFFFVFCCVSSAIVSFKVVTSQAHLFALFYES